MTDSDYRIEATNLLAKFVAHYRAHEHEDDSCYFCGCRENGSHHNSCPFYKGWYWLDRNGWNEESHDE